MADNRFPSVGVDARFPDPVGTDVRFPSPGVDAQFLNGVDTRFTGSVYGGDDNATAGRFDFSAAANSGLIAVM